MVESILLTTMMAFDRWRLSRFKKYWRPLTNRKTKLQYWTVGMISCLLSCGITSPIMYNVIFIEGGTGNGTCTVRWDKLIWDRVISTCEEMVDIVMLRVTDIHCILYSLNLCKRFQHIVKWNKCIISSSLYAYLSFHYVYFVYFILHLHKMFQKSDKIQFAKQPSDSKVSISHDICY